MSISIFPSSIERWLRWTPLPRRRVDAIDMRKYFSPGKVVVFKPEEKTLYPPGYQEAVHSTESFLNSLALHGDLDATEILNDPQRLRVYYQRHYQLSGRASKERDDEKPLLDAVRAGNFPEVAQLYKLIENNTIRVLVPYYRAIFNRLRKELGEEENGITPEFDVGCARPRRMPSVSFGLVRAILFGMFSNLSDSARMKTPRMKTTNGS